MAFVNQVTTSNFVDQKIKVLKVLCQECLQEIGDLIVPAPVGLTMDPKTGKLNAHVTLELIAPPQIRTIEVLMGKVINMGIVPVRLLVDNCVIYNYLEVPFQGIIECPSVESDDETNVQKHDLQVEGMTFSPIQMYDAAECNLKLYLIIKVVVQACVVVSREEILKVNAASQVCVCD